MTYYVYLRESYQARRDLLFYQVEAAGLHRVRSHAGRTTS